MDIEAMSLDEQRLFFENEFKANFPRLYEQMITMRDLQKNILQEVTYTISSESTGGSHVEP